MKDVYKESNLYLSAYLFMCNKVKYEGFEETPTMRRGKPEKKLEFLFSPASKAQEAITEYYAGNALVNARELFDSLRTIKTIIIKVNNSKINEEHVSRK